MLQHSRILCTVQAVYHVSLYLDLFTDFIPYQRFYYFVYQSFDIDSEMCIQRVMQHYSIPQDILERIRSTESNRLCNQSLLNYLLIELRKNKRNHKFLLVVNFLITESTLMRAVQNIHKGLWECKHECYATSECYSTL